jgi:ribonuclease P protein component
MDASGSVPDRDAGFVVVERLKRRSDFRAAAGGARASGRSFVLQARSRGDQGAARVGFTVSRQVGNAAERNRVRRRLREIVRVSAAAATGRLCPGHDYVLVGRRTALAAPFADMMLELVHALSRVHAAETPERGGTGGARRGPLHEASSPPRPAKPRRSRRKLPKPPPGIVERIVEPAVRPPQER